VLLTSGCSFVWGDELDGFDQNPPTHKKLTFTYQLAQKLDMPYVNQGMCGSCNERIFRDLIEYLTDPEKEKPTHMVVIWSAWQRSEFVELMKVEREIEMCLNRPNNFTQFSPHRVNVLSNATRPTRRRRELFEEYHETCYDPKADIAHHLIKMKAIQAITDGLGIKLIQGMFHKNCWANVLACIQDQETPDYAVWLHKNIRDLPKTSRIGLGRYKDLYTIAEELDDIKEHGHPGERTQVIFTEQLFNIFNTEFV
jgi:hypothetical protein